MYMYACQRKEKNKKKPCRTNQEKTILEPIRKGNAQRRNTQMKARKENVEEKDRAHSCLVAQRQKAIVVLFFIFTVPATIDRAVCFFSRFPFEPQARERGAKRRLFFLHHRKHTHFFFPLSCCSLDACTKRRAQIKEKKHSSPSIEHSFYFSRFPFEA